MSITAKLKDEYIGCTHPLASNYNSYGFEGTIDTEFVMDDSQRTIIEEATKSIETDIIPGGGEIRMSVNGHQKNIASLYSLNNFPL